MIAVFTRDRREFEQLGLFPKEMFVHVTCLKNSIGIRFTGIITTPLWWNWGQDEKREAYDYIKRFI